MGNDRRQEGEMTEGGDGKKVCLGLIPNSHGTEARKKRFEFDILDFFCYP